MIDLDVDAKVSGTALATDCSETPAASAVPLTTTVALFAMDHMQ